MTSPQTQTVKEGRSELSLGIWRCGSVVEYLPDMHEALASIVSNTRTHTHALTHAHTHSLTHAHAAF